MAEKEDLKSLKDGGKGGLEEDEEWRKRRTEGG
jgi:hypothetical protein